MAKLFKSIPELIELLEMRGARTNDATPTILMREGYYAVVNGYGKAFLDKRATEAAGDDRYLPGTTFDQMYQLFLFDRDLRALTFRAVMSVECTLRSILSHTFCEHHNRVDSYLQRGCYAQEHEYLYGRQAYDGDLSWLINTLEHHARGYVADARDADAQESERVTWYRERYHSVPLWVLFSDLTFGNLRYFYALMKRAEQRVVCERLCEVCGTTRAGQALSPKGMLADLETLGALRNSCAHEERIYNTRYGSKQLTYPQVLDLLAAYLADEEEQKLRAAIDKLMRMRMEQDPGITRVLKAAGFKGN